jgi:uncharacterized protein YacL (UPF0231 family)
MSKKTQTLIQKFSTYIQVQPQGQNYYIPLYQTDTKLKKIISSHLTSFPNDSEEDCIRYFLQVLKKSDYQDRVAQQLIFCYLQTTCWYASQKVSQELSNTGNLNLHYSHEDCFMIACELTLETAKLLDNFDFDANVSVQTYTQTVLRRMIKNKIVRQLKTKSLKFSDHGLLKNTSKSYLDECLFAYGINSHKITEYGIVFQSFKDLYNFLFTTDNNLEKSKKKDLVNTLNSEQCQIISERVKQQFKRLNLAEKVFQEREIKQILNLCVEIIRNHQNRKSVPWENLHQEIESSHDSLDLINYTEVNEEFNEIKVIIQEEFSSLSLSHKIILLWLGLEIKQTDFIEFLGVKQQFQVSRELKKYLKNILKAIVKKVLVNQTKITTREINQLCNDNIQVIKEYLNYYSKDYFTKMLLEIINHYSSQLNLNSLESEPSKFNFLLRNFETKINEKLDLELKIFSSSQEKMTNFINTTISNNRALLL